jgi:hypothetical protein
VSEFDWKMAPVRSMSRRSVSALVRLPLWAMAMGPRANVAVMGCAFRKFEEPAVEYRT